MELRGIDKAELARRIGADDGNVNRILSGARGLGLGMAVRISVGLGINLIQLLEENPKPKYFKDGLEPPPLPRRRTAKNKGD